ncbi:Glutamine transport ATP-binding protein GlnQ [Polystyrenella longa]|uniref:Glutamine transport ATP-binding protein GlnQ n=1 Tax=Polystyrenella longa TaxID=2528007 RepID=A0A518CHA9_9PLAN|nr:ATP-binding cassette domain-containing protein [Polystyrenella longa]QDU78615.1 Glutamine transport ATP-binding protein GlnQ [Polystyrenella longa]
MKVSVIHQFQPKSPSINTSMVMDHFGIDLQREAQEIIPEMELPIESGQVVCFTGPSGSGKSSLLQNVATQLEGVLDVERLTWEEKPLVDLFKLPVEDSLSLLAACGLGEARLALRSPGELSDGQRFRFRLALGFAAGPKWILCDEFTATLDRKLAHLVAGNMRRLAERFGVGLLLATTHEDIVESLQSDVHVQCLGEGVVEVNTDDGKKKETTSSVGSGSAKETLPTGRTSLGGIIEVIA